MALCLTSIPSPEHLSKRDSILDEQLTQVIDLIQQWCCRARMLTCTGQWSIHRGPMIRPVPRKDINRGSTKKTCYAQTVDSNRLLSSVCARAVNNLKYERVCHQVCLPNTSISSRAHMGPHSPQRNSSPRRALLDTPDLGSTEEYCGLHSMSGKILPSGPGIVRLLRPSFGRHRMASSHK